MHKAHSQETTRRHWPDLDIGAGQWKRLRQLMPQPLVGAAVLALAALAVLASWLRTAEGVSPGRALLAVGLGVSVVAAYQYPLHIRPRTKLYMSSVPFYLLAVLIPAPLAATVAGIAALVGELSVQAQRRTYPSQIATEVGRRMALVLLGAIVAHQPGNGATHIALLLGAALVLGIGDVVTFPLLLVGVPHQPLLRVMLGAARDACLPEGAQYLLGLIGALAAAQQLWAPTLLILPTALIYIAFRRAQDLHKREQAARAQVEQALRVRDDFLMMASHDLRTPLTAIRGFAEVVRMRLDSETTLDKAWLEAQLSRLYDGAMRMTDTVDEITDMAHLQIGHHLSLQMETIDLAALAREVAAGSAPPGRTARAAPVRVDAAGPLLIRGDRRRLARVLENIVGNAVKYSPRGTPVQVTVSRHDRGVIVRVRDHGVGIPAHDLPRIFERFYRASTAQGIAGSGIGLAGAKAIVEQHGGWIKVQSAVEKGTTVTLWLPE